MTAWYMHAATLPWHCARLVAHVDVHALAHCIVQVVVGGEVEHLLRDLVVVTDVNRVATLTMHNLEQNTTSVRGDDRLPAWRATSHIHPAINTVCPQISTSINYRSQRICALDNGLYGVSSPCVSKY